MHKLPLYLLSCCVLAGCNSTEPVAAPETAPVDNADSRAALAAQSVLPQPKVDADLLSCETVAGMTAYCGFQNPEDLVRIPNTNLLIVSEMGEFMADAPGTLSLLNMTTARRETLTIDWSGAAEGAATNWGDKNCRAPSAEAFSPHGIDLTFRSTTKGGGRKELALLVVNHGERESVEFFAVAPSGDLSWRGCALPPSDAFINDVAARRDGGFYVTHMWNKSGQFEQIAATLAAGENTGWVWAWTAEGGFSELPGTRAQMPNGIAISEDNATLYVNAYFGSGTFALDLATQKTVGNVAARQPDNTTVDAEGNLWIASHQHDPIGQSCTAVTAGPCLLPFQIVKADAATLESTLIIDHSGPPMGFATVALRVENRLYLGSAHGDRVVSIELTPDG